MAMAHVQYVKKNCASGPHHANYYNAARVNSREEDTASRVN